MGKTGRVVHLYADGDVKVQVSGESWIFNPLAVTKVSQSHTTDDANEGQYCQKSEEEDVHPEWRRERDDADHSDLFLVVRRLSMSWKSGDNRSIRFVSFRTIECHVEKIV